MYMAKRSATSDGSRKIRAAAYGVLQVTTFNPQRMHGCVDVWLYGHVMSGFVDVSWMCRGCVVDVSWMGRGCVVDVWRVDVCNV